MKHWLVKSEPEAYSWNTFVQEDGTAWTGVRNYQARNNLNLMQPGDLVLFYHSVSEKAIVGLAEVAALAIPDATAEAGSPWVAVPLRPVQPLSRAVGLAQLKAEYDVISSKLVGGQPVVRVFSDVPINGQFQPTEATLEDVYFHRLARKSMNSDQVTVSNSGH